jgi:hypothetical protein
MRLAKFNALLQVSLHDTAVTDSGVAAFKRAAPLVNVSRATRGRQMPKQ